MSSLNNKNDQKISDSAYMLFLEEAALKKEQQIFAHTGHTQTSIVISLIFKYSKDIVRIYAGNLIGIVSNTDFYLQSLNAFLEKGKKLKLLLEDFPDKSSNAYNILLSRAELFPSQVEIRKLDKAASIVLKEHPNGDVSHFVVGDDNMFQLDKNRRNYQGVASFNNHDLTSQLIKIFDNAFKSTSSVGPKITIQKNPNLDTKYLNEIKAIINKLNLG
jgi:hypothetical protein